MKELRRALLANKDNIEVTLAKAQEELAESRRQCAELEDLIERARVVLGAEEPTRANRSEGRTLHAAMELVLHERNEAMSAPDLAAEINRRGLYRRRDGRPVDSGQIHARVGGYGALFARQNRRIALLEASAA